LSAEKLLLISVYITVIFQCTCSA